MIISARAIFMIEGPLPSEAEQRLTTLGKQVRLINTNLWDFECEFRTEDAFQGPFQGNEKYTHIHRSFTLANATAMVERAVWDTLAEFQLHGEVRVVSAIVKRTKKED
jgi:hypothetical protein